MIVLILLLGFLLRLINLNQSLWLDESISALAVQHHTYSTLITQFMVGDVHPPFYYLLLKLWTNYTGYSEVALRFPSLIFGVSTIYIVYELAKRFFKNSRLALIAALFLAINPLAIYYSQEARMYSLVAFAVSLALLFFLRQKWLYFILFFSLAIWSDYLALFMVPVFFALSLKNKKALLALTLCLFFFLPWLPYLRLQLGAGLKLASEAPAWAKIVGQFELKSLPLTLVKFAVGRITIENKIFYALVFGPLSAFYLFLLYRGRQKTLNLWLYLPIIVGALVSLKIPLYSYHRFLFVLPGFVLLLAKAAQNSRLAAVLIFLVSLVSLHYFNLTPQFQREDWKSATRYFRQNPGLVLLPSLATDAPLSYYGPDLVLRDKDNFGPLAPSRVYLLRYVQEVFDPQDLARHTLESSGYVRTGEVTFSGGILVYIYER